MTEQNVEYQSLVQCTDDLTQLIQHNIVSLSSKLFAKGLVAKDVHDIVLSAEGVANHSKAARLLSCVIDRVKECADRYQVFIDVLGEDTFFEDVMQKLSETRRNFLPQSIPTPSPVPMCTVGEPSGGLEVQIDRLDQQYIEIETFVLETIKIRKVPLKEVLNWIRFPPASLRTQFADLLRQQARVVSSATSIDELFFNLSTYWNLFHPALLQHLVNKLGDKELKTRMDRYMDELYRFRIQTTLGDFLDKWVGKIPPCYKEFGLELGEDWREKTVEDFEQSRINVSRMQSFGGGHISFMKTAKSSSILVVLALPEHLFPINLRQKPLHDFLRHEGVLRMMVDGECVLDLGKLFEYESKLFKLCTNEKGGDINKVAHLLSQPGVDPNIFDEEGLTLLWWACELGRSDLATILMDSGVNVDLPNNNKLSESPLITASYWGHVAVCKLLIERGALVDYQNKDGCTALYLASQRGQKEVVELLLDSGASVDKPNMYDGFTALMVASEYGQTKLAGVLITRKATLDYQDKKGCTALYLASQHGQKEVVELLLDSGASVDKPNMEHGFTALIVASQNGQTKVAGVLITRRAALDYQDKGGWSALHYASAFDQPSVVELLVESGVQVDIQTKLGSTVLALASSEGHKHIVDILIKAKCKPDIQDKNGLTALMKATDRGHKDVVKSLLVGNANPNITDEATGRSALSMASEQGNLEIVKLLVKGGADVDLQDKNDLTPLDTAKINNQDKVYKFLQKHSHSERKDITEEQKQRAKTFTKRLRKIFDNVEWMFLRSPVLKEVDQRSRESPSRSAAIQQHTQSHRTRSKKKLMTFEHSKSVGSPSIH